MPFPYLESFPALDYEVETIWTYEKRQKLWLLCFRLEEENVFFVF
jgi:hypothetical protein